MKLFFKNNRRKIIIGAMFLIIFASSILLRYLTSLDEIWQYNIARNIYDGLLPYKDISMITTPLSNYLSLIFLWLFGNNVIALRYESIIIALAILWLVYKILKYIKVDYRVIVSLLICLMILLVPYVSFDYNFIQIILILSIIYFELLSANKSNSKLSLIIGILVGLAITNKQTTGMIIAIVLIIISLIKNKNVFKDLLWRLLGIILPVGVLFLYLFKFNIWNDFINYCFVGIKEFTNHVPYYNLILSSNKLIAVLAIIIPIITVIVIFLHIKNKNIDKNVIIMLLYSLISLLVMYPIADDIHFIVSIVPLLILFGYLINKNTSRIDSNKILNSIYVGLLISLIFISFCSIGRFVFLWGKDTDHNLKHYNSLTIDGDVVNEITTIDNYILSEKSNGVNVYIIDPTSAFFMIPLDKYTKNFDMLLNGNIGAGGNNKIIDIINQADENSIFLIKNVNYKRNWQNPELIRSYIISNMTKMGEIKSFDIYKKYVKNSTRY